MALIRLRTGFCRLKIRRGAFFCPDFSTSIEAELIRERGSLGVKRAASFVMASWSWSSGGWSDGSLRCDLRRPAKTTMTEQRTLELGGEMHFNNTPMLCCALPKFPCQFQSIPTGLRPFREQVGRGFGWLLLVVSVCEDPRGCQELPSIGSPVRDLVSRESPRSSRPARAALPWAAVQATPSACNPGLCFLEQLNHLKG
jgi:hypothetical protein